MAIKNNKEIQDLSSLVQVEITLGARRKLKVLAAAANKTTPEYLEGVIEELTNKLLLNK